MIFMRISEPLKEVAHPEVAKKCMAEENKMACRKTSSFTTDGSQIDSIGLN